MQSEVIEAVGADGHVLRVEFAWRGDRFGQVVSLVESSGRAEALLQSIEGLPDENWPASPPLQSLSVHTLPDGRHAALLVGMAGGNHWSASIEPAAAGAELVFDLACRHASQPAWLGNRYQRLPAGLKNLSIRGTDLNIKDDEELWISPAILREGPSTTRWRFSIELNTAIDDRS